MSVASLELSISVKPLKYIFMVLLSASRAVCVFTHDYDAKMRTQNRAAQSLG